MIIYGDFNCPFSYLASLRLDALLNAGMVSPDDVEWRAIEHETGLPELSRRLDDAARAELEAELAAVRELLEDGEELPLATPSVIPKTDAAIAGYAEAFGAGVANEARRALFDAYWARGRDIGSPEVLRSVLAPVLRGCRSESFSLREAGFAVSMSRAPITASAYGQIRAWRAAWQLIGSQTIPAVAGPRAATGLAALAKLRPPTRKAEPSNVAA